jgi:Flp pilus assembly protein TadG
MTRLTRKLSRNQQGTAVMEFAIAVPVLVSFIWGIFQVSMLLEAQAGMQSALGQAARYATIYPTPTDTQIQTKITSAKFGLANGTWGTPTITTTTTTKLINVTYSQPTNFLFFNGPTVTLSDSKLVYLSN